MTWSVIGNIMHDDKRMNKVRSIASGISRREKIRNYVIAECQRVGVRENGHEIARMTAYIMNRV